MGRKVPLRVICGLMIALLCLGEKKVVTLRDGRKITGEVIRTDQGVQVQTAYGPLDFAVKDIVSIESVTSPQQEYKDRLAKIDPKDAESHYELAEWAVSQDLLEIAKAELLEALKLKPRTDKYSWLLKDVEARLAKAAGAKAPDVKAPGAGDTPAPAAKADLLLGEDDIYRVRLVELRADDQVSIEFRNKMVDRFGDQMRGKGDFRRMGFWEEFLAFTPVQKAVYILRHVDPDNTPIKDDILVKSDPKFIVDFRTRVWPVVSQSCASASCHGGGEKPRGGLRFVSGTGTRVDYTNFMILAGWFSGGKRVVNRDLVDRSLLLQYALPAEQAKIRHPVDIPTIVESRRAPQYQMLAEWIDLLAGPPQPDYRLKWTPPFGMQLDLSGQASWAVTSEPASSEPAK